MTKASGCTKQCQLRCPRQMFLGFLLVDFWNLQREFTIMTKVTNIVQNHPYKTNVTASHITFSIVQMLFAYY
jgi:hypothetical protein